MFKLRKKKNTFVTVRAENLEVGDRFVYDYAAMEVWQIIPDGNDEVSVTLGYTHIHPDGLQRARVVVLRNELLITVSR